MSYQIKQTPFFQRMLSTSKKNGQLAKLKEEYERIKDFNDHTIDMKMRQVRLKRLFREIEDIKDGTISTTSTQTKRRRLGIERIRSMEAMRMAAFLRAKELGKEYSKLNAHMDRCTHARLDAQTNGISTVEKLESERRARSTKRISYGNEISRTNVEKIAQRPRKKKSLKRDLFNVSSIDVVKKERLLQRLNYGNSRSSLNMSKIPKRHAKHKIATEALNFKISDAKVPKAKSGSSSSSSRDREQKVTCFNITSKDTQILQTYEELKDCQIQLILAGGPENDAEQRARAKKRWHKISLTIRHRFNTPRLRRFQQSLKMCDEHDHILRMISNEMHLPQSILNGIKVEPSSQCEAIITDTDDADDYDDANDEMLYNVEPLTNYDDSTTKPRSLKSAQLPETSTFMYRPMTNIREQYEQYKQKFDLLPPPSPSLLLNEITCNAPETRAPPVEKYPKMFVPNEAASKEAEEFSVQKLRNIFEHQT